MEPTIDLDALYLAQVTLNCLPLVLCGECTSRMAVQPLQARLGTAWVSFLHHLAKEWTAGARMAFGENGGVRSHNGIVQPLPAYLLGRLPPWPCFALADLCDCLLYTSPSPRD